MKRRRKMKWWVHGEFGGQFTNLKEAKACAKEASKTAVWLIGDGCHYIEYENGKCVRDGWTIKGGRA